MEGHFIVNGFPSVWCSVTGCRRFGNIVQFQFFRRTKSSTNIHICTHICVSKYMLEPKGKPPSGRCPPEPSSIRRQFFFTFFVVAAAVAWHFQKCCCAKLVCISVFPYQWIISVRLKKNEGPFLLHLTIIELYNAYKMVIRAIKPPGCGTFD